MYCSLIFKRLIFIVVNVTSCAVLFKDSKNMTAVVTKRLVILAHMFPVAKSLREPTFP